jgi:asparagine synthase (glutamine-hydrolysing)
MCGIAGIFHFAGSPDDTTGVVPRMLDALAIRGPDGSGSWSDAVAELGHRRLAIVDLSPAGSQPMVSACGRYVLSLNGEIYNYREVARELGLTREHLRSRADSEVLLEAWARVGASILPRLAGQWAFALLDTRERCLWLVRDRFGEKPLYYHRQRDRLTFASSISALLRAPWIRKAIDPRALVELVTMRYVVSPRTILEDIQKIPPGHLMRVETSGARLERWYDIPAPRPGGRRSRRASVDEFDHLLRQATNRCLVSDVPVALFLSDGIDSHAIAAAGPETLQSFSYVSREDSIGDVGARPHHTAIHRSDSDRLADLEAAFGSLTEPVGDGVALATWQLVRAARPSATVFLCGHGGDEILGGYRLNRDVLTLRLLRRVCRLPAPLLRGACDRALNGTGSSDERLRRLRASADGAAAGALYMINRPLGGDDVQLMFGESVDISQRLSAVEELYAEIDGPRGDLDRIQYVMAKTFLAENLLSFSDSVGMASSAEIRVPYLDHDLVEYVLTRDESERTLARPGRQNTKRLLRRWARGRVPDEVIRRKKRGFKSGHISHLLESDPAGIRGRILDIGELRSRMPGLERWLANDTTFFRGSREGTFWAILALAVWYSQLD